jgi:hypothetical protein
VPSSASSTTSTPSTGGSSGSTPTTVIPSPSRSSHTRPPRLADVSSPVGTVVPVGVVSSGGAWVVVVGSSSGGAAAPVGSSGGGSMVVVVVVSSTDSTSVTPLDVDVVSTLSPISNDPSIDASHPWAPGDPGGSLFHCQKTTRASMGSVTSPSGWAPGRGVTSISIHTDSPGSSCGDTQIGVPTKSHREPSNRVRPVGPSTTRTSKRSQPAGSAAGPYRHSKTTTAGMVPVLEKSIRPDRDAGSQTRSPSTSTGNSPAGGHTPDPEITWRVRLWPALTSITTSAPSGLTV